MKQLFFITLGSLMLLSCQNTTTVNNLSNISNNLRYIHDSRTNKCFCTISSISVGSLSKNVSITEVTCDSLVFEAIKKDTL